VEISRDDLRALVEASEVVLERETQAGARGRLAQVGLQGRQGDPQALRGRLVLVAGPAQVGAHHRLRT
jgi:hypothetical protein